MNQLPTGYIPLQNTKKTGAETPVLNLSFSSETGMNVIENIIVYQSTKVRNSVSKSFHISPEKAESE